jgi:hypothetical protein
VDDGCLFIRSVEVWLGAKGEYSRSHRSWQSRYVCMSGYVSCNLRTWNYASLCRRKHVISRHVCRRGSYVSSTPRSPCYRFHMSLKPPSLCCKFRVSWSICCYYPSMSLFRRSRTWCMTSFHMILIRVNCLTSTDTSCLTRNSCLLRMMVMSSLTTSCHWIQSCLRSTNPPRMNCSLSLSRSFLLKNRSLSFLGELQSRTLELPQRVELQNA